MTDVKIICHFLVYTFICRFKNDQVGWLKEKEKKKHFIILFDNKCHLKDFYCLDDLS